jgi:class 3 adenylate cyclase/CheY-like chemotaxis protein
MPPAGTVTVLFTDLAASTEMIGRVGDASGERILADHLNHLRDVLINHGGQEVKPTGDGLMVAFRSSLDAVNCAVALQQDAEWHGRHGTERLGLKVGIHAGEATPQDGDYYGLWVVVARRLCEVAQAGQILTTELVRQLAGPRSGQEMKPLGEFDLKGIADPVAVVEVGWSPVDEPAHSNSQKILMVDDEEANLLVLDRLLRRSGYENLVATTDPRRVLDLFLAEQPDLVLLDLSMPYLDGFEVMQQLQARMQPGGYLPILVLTADVTPEAMKRALAMGARDFITKPFDPTEVLLRIRNLLETRALYLELQAKLEGSENP